MKPVVLRADMLGKCYVTFSSNLSRFATWFGLSTNPVAEHWAVRDVSFTLGRGEAVGLIGKNGAGKSTLLKLITGTIRPTTGTIHTAGRLSAILELGLGFNPELTGRQNVYLAGGMIGLGTDELDELLVGIEEFSELGHFFDRPIRVYSSGMKARLAFALATCKRPDVLIVDEALSVGDMAFQRKCFRKIENFLECGTSLLFVSHDIESVRRICTKAIYLRDGIVSFLGSAGTACNYYEKDAYGRTSDVSTTATTVARDVSVHPSYDTRLAISSSESYGRGHAEIVGCWLENGNGMLASVFENGELFYWCYKVVFFQQIDRPIFGMRVKTVDGVDVFSTNSEMLNRTVSGLNQGVEIVVRFKLVANLAPNYYFLNAGISEKDPSEHIVFLHRRVDAMKFRVTSRDAVSSFGGIADLQPQLSIETDTSSNE